MGVREGNRERFPEILFLKQALPESKTFGGMYQKQDKVHPQYSIFRKTA